MAIDVESVNVATSTACPHGDPDDTCNADNGASRGALVAQSGRMCNRHGLVAGATGTGKTVTLQTLAEGFSRMGTPVLAVDVR